MGARGKSESLALLEAAFDAGIRHFDVAPAYGFGQAEGCLGEFIATRRDQVTITTKYGIPPAKSPGLVGLARRLAKPLVHALPGVKRRLAHVAGKAFSGGEKAAFSAAEARQSLERSLRELKTERIDLWLLHEVRADDLRNADELLHFLEDRVAEGTIGAFGVGSQRSRAETLAIKRPQFCGVVQFEWSVNDRPVKGMEGFRIHHRALTDNFRALHAGLVADKRRCVQWSEEVGADLADRDALAGLMLKAALVENGRAIVLFSSKDPLHMKRNVEVAEDRSLESPARRLYKVVQTAAQGVRETEAGG
ncbi:MAG: aldo/keto reductase [Acidobacteriota bacterium]|nr:aldo/keto reductase [Acidobacteriota bacterium]